MGAAAFIMVEFTGFHILKLLKIALIPALLAYVGILFMVFEKPINIIFPEWTEAK